MRHKQLNTVYFCVMLFFLLFIFVPLIYILKNAFFNNGVTLSYVRKVFIKEGGGSSPFLTAFYNSLHVSLVSSLITTLLSFILAYTVSFTRLPSFIKKIIRTLAVFPMLLPTITYGFLIIYSFGKTGLLTRLFGKKLFNFYGFNGLVFSYIVYTLPISFTLIKNTMGYIDKKFLVVSRLLGDGGGRRFYNCILQPLWSTIACSVIQSFFLSFTDFGVPASIAGNYKTVATLLYNTMLGSLPDFHKGSVIALFMLLPSVISVLLLNRLQKENVRYSKSIEVEVKENRARDITLCLLSFLILLCILSIFLVLFVSPLVAQWPYNMTFSFDNVKNILGDNTIFSTYLHSLLVSFLTALLGTLFIYASVLITARSNLHKKSNIIIEGIAQITNTTPGMVLGISYLLAFNNTPLKNTILILVACNIVHFFATPYLMLRNTLDKINSSYEATASILGDNWIKTVIRVITPNVLPTLLEVAIYLFINGMVTVSAVVFLCGARTMIITTKIQELQHFAKFNEIFVLSILILFTNLVMKAIKGAVNSKVKV